jgi:xanthine dehydrogenase accessory factor
MFQRAGSRQPTAGTHQCFNAPEIHRMAHVKADGDMSEASPTKPANMLEADDVLGQAVAWHRQGHRLALVTLIAIDGATPRPLGAQMVVTADGRHAGYLSGGCVEDSVVLEAQAAMQERKNRLVRFGKGSAYFDIKLPCGSGLDLYFDQSLDGATLEALTTLRSRRSAFWFATNIETGRSSLNALDEDGASAKCHLDDQVFHRLCLPRPRVLVIGGGPALPALASLIHAAGFELDCYSPDAVALRDVEARGVACHPLTSQDGVDTTSLDCWTAAVIAFHEHDWEAPVLAKVLKSPCFYIGVMGSKAAHADRLAALSAMGFGPDELARIKSPIGLIPGAKSRATLAIGVVAELAAAAKARGLLA